MGNVGFTKDNKLGAGELSGETISALAAGTEVRYRGSALDAPWGEGDEIKSGGLEIDEGYIIKAQSLLDFTTIGSADSNVGTKFTATGSLTMTAADYVATFRSETFESQIPSRFHMALVAYVLMTLFPLTKVKKIDREGNVVEVTGDFVAARFWESQWNRYVKRGKKYANMARLRRDFSGAGPDIMSYTLE